MRDAKRIWDATTAPDIEVTSAEWLTNRARTRDTLDRGGTVCIMNKNGEVSSVIGVRWNPERDHGEHMEHLRDALGFFEEWAEGEYYGHFPGGDPHLFTPDPEECSAEEIAGHRAACEAWGRGEIEGIALTGIGKIRWRDEEMVRVRDGLRAALEGDT